MTDQPKAERVPPLSMQFNQGAYAFSRGWIANDYKPETVKGKEWQRGFNAAYFANIDKLKRV